MYLVRVGSNFRFSIFDISSNPNFEVITSPIGTSPTPIDGACPLDNADIIWLLFEYYLMKNKVTITMVVFDEIRV